MTTRHLFPLLQAKKRVFFALELAFLGMDFPLKTHPPPIPPDFLATRHLFPLLQGFTRHLFPPVGRRTCQLFTLSKSDPPPIPPVTRHLFPLLQGFTRHLFPLLSSACGAMYAQAARCR